MNGVAFISVASTYPLRPPSSSWLGAGRGERAGLRRAMQECAGILMQQRRPGLRQGNTVIEAGNLNLGSCLEGRHVIDPKAPTRRDRAGCTWSLRRTGGSSRYQEEHGTRDWGLWANRTGLLPLDSHRRRHPSTCDWAKKNGPACTNRVRAGPCSQNRHIVSFAHQTYKTPLGAMNEETPVNAN